MDLLTLIVLLPLAGFVLNGLAGNRLGKRFVTAVGCGLPILAFLVTVQCFVALAAGDAPLVETAYTWAVIGGRAFEVAFYFDRLARGHGPDRDRRRLADPRLLDRLHEGGQELRALLRVPEPLPLLHAAARARTVAPRALRRLGGRGARVLPADRLLVRGPRQGARGKEGVHHQPRRRRGVPARHVRAVRDARHARDGRDQRRVHGQPGACGLREPGRRSALHRRLRQIGADPAPRLAARRDGRSDAGLGADPCRDDGDRRRLHGRPSVRHLPARARGVADRRGDRRAHRVLRGDDRRRADRHQEGARLLDDLAARLHVRGAGGGRIRRRHLPPLHPRLLQGLPLPGRGQRDPRALRRAGHHAGWAGSRRKIPLTFVTFAVATAAIAGLPPLAGFFSKDEILWFAFASSRGGSILLLAYSRGYGVADGVLHVPAAVARRSSARRGWTRRPRTTSTSRRPR